MTKPKTSGPGGFDGARGRRAGFDASDLRASPGVRQAIAAAHAWLLDFDGTLTDYVDAHRLGLSALQADHLAHVASEPLAEAADDVRARYYKHAAVHGRGAGLDAFLVGRLLEQFGATPDERAVACYRDALCTATVAAPHAHRLLGGLRRRGRSLAVVTNAYDVGAQRRRVEATGLTDHLDAVVIAAEVGRFKPDPGLLEEAARLLGIGVAHCVAVGDSVELDIVPARAAGMTSVLVGPVDHPSADVWASDLGVLHDALTGLLRGGKSPTTLEGRRTAADVCPATEQDQ